MPCCSSGPFSWAASWSWASADQSKWNPTAADTDARAEGDDVRAGEVDELHANQRNALSQIPPSRVRLWLRGHRCLPPIPLRNRNDRRICGHGRRRGARNHLASQAGVGSRGQSSATTSQAYPTATVSRCQEPAFFYGPRCVLDANHDGPHLHDYPEERRCLYPFSGIPYNHEKYGTPRCRLRAGHDGAHEPDR